MKRSFKPLLQTLALGGILAFSVDTFADEIKFADLEKKLSVDKTPATP